MAINRESIRNHKSSKSLVIVNCSMCCIVCITIIFKKNTALSEHFKNSIEKSQKESKSMTLTHKYMTDHFSDLIQALG